MSIRPSTFAAPGLDKMGASVDRILKHWKRDNVAQSKSTRKIN